MKSSVEKFINPDSSKQGREIYFSRKQNQVKPLLLRFNDNTGQLYNNNDNNNKDDNNNNNNNNNSNNFIQNFCSSAFLLCRHITYGKPGNVNFESKLESVQCNATLAVTGAIQRSNRDSIYAELGLESLSATF